MKTEEVVIENLRKLGLGPQEETEFIDFIMNTDSELYDGRNSAGETVVVGVQKGAGIQVSTYQDNGWIRINRFELVEDDEKNLYIEQSETYDR